jgi:hypothetical protein
VRFIVPVQEPSIILPRKAFFSACDPQSSSAWIAPCVSSGQSENDMFDAVSISSTAVATSFGRPCPPHSGPNGSAPQPPST